VSVEDEDFDVEAWNRRLAETPSGPIGPPRVRTRHLDRPRHPSEQPLDPPDLQGPVPALDPEPLDALVDPVTGTDAVAEQGFPAFEHGQWTVEGEIERFGAFGRGAARSRGWRRGIALVLLGLLVLPLVLQTAHLVSRVLS